MNNKDIIEVVKKALDEKISSSASETVLGLESQIEGVDDFLLKLDSLLTEKKNQKSEIDNLINKGKTPKIAIQWEISHFESKEGVCIQVWQYINGCGDGGFSCLLRDIKSAVSNHIGVGQLSLKLNNAIYEYIKTNNLK